MWLACRQCALALSRCCSDSQSALFKNYFNIWHLKITGDQRAGLQATIIVLYPAVWLHWWQMLPHPLIHTKNTPRMKVKWSGVALRTGVRRDKGRTKRPTIKWSLWYALQGFLSEQVINETFKPSVRVWERDWEELRATDKECRRRREKEDKRAPFVLRLAGCLHD